MTKLRKWVGIFFWAEIAGSISSILSGLITNHFFQNQSFTAIGATIGENIGFYGVILWINLYQRMEKPRLQVIQTLVFQFGITEVFDSLLIRPLCMYYCQEFIHHLPLALLIGKLTADLFFYLIAFFFISKVE